MIEEAKEPVRAVFNCRAMLMMVQDNAPSTSGGSETAEDNNGGRSLMGFNSEQGTPTSNPRVPLPYPSASPLPNPSPYPVPTGQYVPSSARPFESMSPVSANASMPPRPSPQQRASPEANNPLRLPSITSSGQLIEPSLAAQEAALSSHQSEPNLYGRERTIGSPIQGQYSPGRYGSRTLSPSMLTISLEISKQRSAPG